jgi:hypothetical protein
LLLFSTVKSNTILGTTFVIFCAISFIVYARYEMVYIVKHIFNYLFKMFTIHNIGSMRYSGTFSYLVVNSCGRNEN